MATDAQATPEQVADEPTLLAEELVAVEQLLQAAVVALYAPLNDLAHAQIKKAHPYRCATVVLAAGVSTPDSEALRQQRLYLAAALEMLNIALAIHQLLLAGTGRQTHDEENPNQRSITGSVILTGDFCFTQSAILAAKTDNVRVVEIFSETLKTVSEGILRQLFAQRNEQTLGLAPTPSVPSAVSPFNTELALCEAGVEGTAVLLASPPAVANATKQIVRALVPIWHTTHPVSDLSTLPFHNLPLAQQRRWQAVLTKK
jgi:geranylgeranyl pyrophosphate synthase